MKKYDQDKSENTSSKDSKSSPKFKEGLARLSIEQLHEIITAAQGELLTRAHEGSPSQMSQKDFEAWSAKLISQAEGAKTND